MPTVLIFHMNVHDEHLLTFINSHLNIHSFEDGNCRHMIYIYMYIINQATGKFNWCFYHGRAKTRRATKFVNL